MTIREHIVCVLEKAALVAIILGSLIVAEMYVHAYPYAPPAQPDQSTAASPVTTQRASAVDATDIITLTNQNRTQAGVPALVTSPLLTEAAQLKANDMASRSYYAHVSPDGKSPLYWLDLVGYHYINAGENLVIDRTTSEQVVDAWMNSPDHRENILRPQFTEIGVGTASGVYEGLNTIYVVQEFGMPMPTVPVQILPKTTVPVAPTHAIAPTTAVSAPATAPAPKSVTLTTRVDALAIPLVPRFPTLRAVPAPVVASSSTLQADATSTAPLTVATVPPLFTLPDAPPVSVTAVPTSPASPASSDPLIPLSIQAGTEIHAFQLPLPIDFHAINSRFQDIIRNYVPL